MTVMNPSAIRSRIKTATLRSPIAVFETGKDQLEAIFAGTIKAQCRIDAQDPALIGVFAGPGGVERFDRWTGSRASS